MNMDEYITVERLKRSSKRPGDIKVVEHKTEEKVLCAVSVSPLDSSCLMSVI